MQAKFTKKIGNAVFEFTCEADSQIEFFQSVSFYNSLPETAPKGATDLVLRHRVTSKGDYYSLVSEKEGVEFMLGQYKQKKGKDELFPKGWQPIWVPNSEESNSNDLNSANMGLGAQVVNEPVPTPSVSAPTVAVAAPKVATPNLGSTQQAAQNPVDSSTESDAQAILNQFMGV